MGFGASALLVLLTDVKSGTSNTTLTPAELIVTYIVLITNLVQNSKEKKSKELK